MNYYDYFESFLAGGKDKNRRKVKGNTYAERLANGNIGLRFHATMVCEYWPNGNVTLRSGGWQTVTTQDRINKNSPVRVYSNKGSWAIWHASDAKTPAKIQKCRVCHGTGVGKGWTCWGPASYDYSSGSYRQIPLQDRKPCQHGEDGQHTIAGTPGGCYRCNGQGMRDYGSKAIPTPFYDGIIVDMSGKVISGDYSPFPAYTSPSVISKPVVSGDTILKGLAAVIPGLMTATAVCPVCIKGGATVYGIVNPSPIPNVIMHLNDAHQKSRADIADWLDTLDVNLSFSSN